jgi:predicted nuclease of predicted toxin-antitoxin system
MRILADENIDRPIAAWLRDQGHDVVEAAAVAPETADTELIAISRRDGRVLMTFDRDIGRLVQCDAAPHPGVVFLRLRGAGPQLWETFKRIWPQIESVIGGHFVTVKNEQVRRRPLPIQPS